jgi:putative phosphotransacetylase
MEENLVNEITTSLALRQKREKKPVIANVSNRHMHICREDLDKLFGAGYELKVKNKLMQPGEFASEDTLKITGPKGSIDKVRVLGPVRKDTQIEISITDSFALGIKAPVRQSGDVRGSPGIKITGPKGEIEIKEGVIAAKRHVHMTPADAAYYEIKDGDALRVKTSGERAVIFENMVARVSDKMSLECHIDTDEANAASLKNGDMVIIL